MRSPLIEALAQVPARPATAVTIQTPPCEGCGKASQHAYRTFEGLAWLCDTHWALRVTPEAS